MATRGVTIEQRKFKAPFIERVAGKNRQTGALNPRKEGLVKQKSQDQGKMEHLGGWGSRKMNLNHKPRKGASSQIKGHVHRGASD